jgi:membrane protease YdiL (CAAX protease family)
MTLPIAPSETASPSLGRSLVLGVALVWALSGVLPDALVVEVLAVGLAMAAGVAFRAPEVVTAGLGAMAFLLPLSAVSRVPWPLPQAVVLFALIVLLRAPRMRRHATWARRGRWDRGVTKWVVVFCVVPAVALVVWRYTTNDNLDRFRAFIPDAPLWAVVCGLPVLAAFNAAYEEALFRGALMEALDCSLGPSMLPLVVQAAVFGMCHYHGFPSGWIGVGLATVYGLMMGYVRRISDGLFAAWVAHVVADTVILSLVTLMVFAGR